MWKRSVNNKQCALSRAVIRRAIKDLAGDVVADYMSAATYVNGATFSVDCENAGYPAELLDSLKAMVLLSRAERLFCQREITTLLDKVWAKKTPRERGFSTST
jgi:hypothetical protein